MAGEKRSMLLVIPSFLHVGDHSPSDSSSASNRCADAPSGGGAPTARANVASSVEACSWLHLPWPTPFVYSPSFCGLKASTSLAVWCVAVDAAPCTQAVHDDSRSPEGRSPSRGTELAGGG